MQVAESSASLGALVVNEMHLLYGAKFAQQWEGLTPRELKDSWNQKLSGLTEAQVRRGLTACLTREWPPTLPEFLKLCCPWLIPELAYHEAVRGVSARRRGRPGTGRTPRCIGRRLASVRLTCSTAITAPSKRDGKGP